MTEKELKIDTEEGTITEQDVSVQPKSQQLTLNRLLEGLSMGVANGTVSKAQRREILSRFGISQAYFTRKQVKPETRKKKRKAQRLARKISRRKGWAKGQQVRAGQKYSVNT